MKGVMTVLAAVCLMVSGAAYAQETGKAADKPMKPGKTMTAKGTVKSVSADSLTVTDKDGKDWTFAVDKDTEVTAKGASHKTADKKEAGEKTMITDFVKEGAKVQVKYHDMGETKHAASVRVM
jgi:hypothetical protein